MSRVTPAESKRQLAVVQERELSLTDHWRKLIWKAASSPTLAISGVRKICSDISFEIPWDALTKTELTYQDICYTAAKGRQLQRNYWDQDEVDAAVKKLLSRKGKDHSSVSIQMRGQVKDSRSQGFCMQNTVITMTPTACTIDIYYRSTELVQKFLADLIFFADKFPPIFEELGRTPTIIRFKFANVYLSAVFMPIFLRYEYDPVGFFEKLAVSDPKFFRTCGLATRRFFNATHNYTYRTRVKMFEYWKEHVKPNKRLQKMLAGLKGEIVIDDEGDEE